MQTFVLLKHQLQRIPSVWHKLPLNLDFYFFYFFFLNELSCFREVTPSFLVLSDRTCVCAKSAPSVILVTFLPGTSKAKVVGNYNEPIKPSHEFCSIRKSFRLFSHPFYSFENN